MVDSSAKFLIDANTLMTASRFFYAYDLAPSFWKSFEDQIKAGKIILLDMVKAEIDKYHGYHKPVIEGRNSDRS